MDPLFSAGCDEVGRGCLAGPVVAAAVILPPGTKHPLLRDSKKLSPATIRQMSDWITQHAIAHSIASTSPSRIDAINILQASIETMHKALAALAVQPEYILVDGNRFRPYLDIPYECIVGGDAKHACIAAASIIAKNSRDLFMQNLDALYPVYGWQSNVGYPTPLHKEMLIKHGPTPFHRLSFKGVSVQQPTQKV